MDIFHSRSKFKNAHGKVLDFNVLHYNLLVLIKFKKLKLNVTEAQEDGNIF
jgi:hypothetical protein